MDFVGLIDMDGTIADYDAAMRAGLEDLRSPNDPPTTVSHDDNPPWLEKRRWLIAMQPGFWRGLKPIPHGFAVMALMEKYGFTLQVLTKGPASKPMAWMEKLEWCRQHIPHMQVTITEDKSNVYGVVLVDDWLDYGRAWLRHRPRGILIVPAQRWNVGCESEDPTRIYRYDPETCTLDELERVIAYARNRAPKEPVDIRKVIGSR